MLLAFGVREAAFVLLAVGVREAAFVPVAVGVLGAGLVPVAVGVLGAGLVPVAVGVRGAGLRAGRRWGARGWPSWRSPLGCSGRRALVRRALVRAWAPAGGGALAHRSTGDGALATAPPVTGPLPPLHR
ncbi:hypothetical protein GCM10009730_17920 [Streptomyces albidochromogenes]